MPDKTPVHVFSYGTLRHAKVQRELYGREVRTTPDSLPGYRLSEVTITDPKVLRVSGTDSHPIALPGEPSDHVDGAVLSLTPRELAATDEYEVADYVRREVRLSSGITAWLYAAADPV